MAVENTDGIYYTEVIRAITAALQAIAAAIAEIERAFLLVHDSQTARGQKKLTANPGSTSSQEDKMLIDSLSAGSVREAWMLRHAHDFRIAPDTLLSS